MNTNPVCCLNYEPMCPETCAYATRTAEMMGRDKRPAVTWTDVLKAPEQCPVSLQRNLDTVKYHLGDAAVSEETKRRAIEVVSELADVSACLTVRELHTAIRWLLRKDV